MAKIIIGIHGLSNKVAEGTIDQLREYREPQTYGRADDAPKKTVDGAVTTSKWRVVLDRKSDRARDQPPVPAARAMRRIIYGLPNVRTDGERRLFALRNESAHSWAYETLEAEKIASAVTISPDES